MRNRGRILLGGLTAALALAALVGVANARRLEFSEQHWLAHFEAVTYSGGGLTVICPISLEGSFHSRTLSKMSGQLIGYITEAAIGHPCRENEAYFLNGTEVLPEGTVINTLPWHLLYISFSGVLPRIRTIRISIRGMSLLLLIGGMFCLYKSTEARPDFVESIVNEATGAVTRLRFDETASIPKFSGSILCPSTITYAGTGIFGTQVGYREIFVRLVQ